MGRREWRRADRARKEEEDRAQLLELMRDYLRQADEYIETQKAEMARNIDIEQGIAQLPPLRFSWAVENRNRLVEIITDLEEGAPLSEVRKKMQRLQRDAEDWQRRARKFNVS